MAFSSATVSVGGVTKQSDYQRLMDNTINNRVSKYSTGWLLNEIGGSGVGKWTNAHLGTDPTQDSNLNHALDAPLSELIVKVFLSTDGTDANSFELREARNDGDGLRSGYTIYHIDNNNIQVQTSANGLTKIDTAGLTTIIDTEDWYYKIVVYKLG